jgi:hypothetical protein
MLAILRRPCCLLFVFHLHIYSMQSQIPRQHLSRIVSQNPKSGRTSLVLLAIRAMEREENAYASGQEPTHQGEIDAWFPTVSTTTGTQQNLENDWTHIDHEEYPYPPFLRIFAKLFPITE